ncbi:MAG: hypothetical protein OXC01_06375 [Immundisolibacterales bacterium]|nr:hypothetical protein [Immundisolibacterales bacterium]
MCGIVGLYAKNPELRPRLGELVSPMLVELGDRGPDSAGIAFYRRPVAGGGSKITVHHVDPGYEWGSLRDAFAARCGADVEMEVRGSHATLASPLPPADVERWFGERHPELRVMSVGDTIELYKEKGLPVDVVDRFGFRDIDGSHALGHTRMATESAVTTEHSHPFSTGLDLCLVHNGSLSNHNRLRRNLRREGIAFQTDNDTEVAAGYLTWRLREGDSLDEALEAANDDLDGFYTFAVATRDGFAVLRDPIACKPAVLAETEDWVAMGSEFRAIAPLPGADRAEIWEPTPGRVYHWGGATT